MDQLKMIYILIENIPNEDQVIKYWGTFEEVNALYWHMNFDFPNQYEIVEGYQDEHGVQLLNEV